MPEQIIGVMWAKNEGDLLPYTIPAAQKMVDALLVVDDDSTDNSYDVMKSFKLDYLARKRDIGYDTRQHLMDITRQWYGHKDTWVQIIESDTILDPEIPLRDLYAKWAVKDVGVTFHMLNCVRRDWDNEYDRAPTFGPGREPWVVLPEAHYMERLLYAFRPLPGLSYLDQRRVPWPRGFAQYGYSERRKRRVDNPLVWHYGFRSPTHYYNKMKAAGRKKTGKYTEWRFDNPQAVKDTVYLYNGVWNRHPIDVFPTTRECYGNWLDTKGDDV